MKKYSKYKKTDIDWIGEIPEEWEVLKMKRILKGIKDGTHGTHKRVDKGYPLLSAKNVFDKGLKITSEESQISEKEFRSIVSNGFPKRGDVLFTSVGTIGRVLVFEEPEPMAFQRSVTFLRFKEEINPKYVAYTLRSSFFQEKLLSGAKTSAQSGIYMSDLSESYILYCSRKQEQTAIATYLDHKTALIDELITKNSKLITLLEEKRKATINQAVTKGLDPDVKMKDSGVEWIGEIPEHWEVKKLKYILLDKKDALKTGPFGSDLKNSDILESGEYRVYNQRNVLDQNFIDNNEFISQEKFNSLKSCKIDEGDILVTTRGTIGHAAIFPGKVSLGILHPCLIRIQIDRSIADPKWITSYINDSTYFKTNVKYNSNSTVLDVIYGYTLKEIFIPIPPVEMQVRLLEYIEEQKMGFNNLISKIERQNKLLKEYRGSLISHVVTGKVKVV